MDGDERNAYEMNRMAIDSGRDGIFLRNVSLAYSDQQYHILNGVDMSAKRGQIYGLLGPSGCGKTTLIRCVLGLKKPDFGDVKVFNHRPRIKGLGIPGPNAGYMPQEIALYEDLTIFEMLTYFGRVFLMNSQLLHKRVDHLIGLLQLPESQRFIRNLSGGQQRRVSFAATILHQPSLIVLDEPTVGVDPLLREKIWEHLMQLSIEKGCTILVTTHYIEEAKRASKIGFMRKGRILCEGQPLQLLKQHHATTLEQVFLHICVKKRKSTIVTPDDLIHFKQAYRLERHLDASFEHKSKEHKPAVRFANEQCTIDPQIDCNCSQPNLMEQIEMSQSSLKKMSFCKQLVAWLRVFFALLIKNLAQDLRNPLNVSFQYLSPIGQVLLFALCIGRDPQKVPVGVYVQEFSFLNFTHKFLNAVDTPAIQLQYYTNEQQALQDARAGKLWAVITFPRYYSHSFIERQGQNVSNYTIKQSTITIRADMTNRIVTDLTYKSLSDGYKRFVRQQIQDYSVGSKFSDTYIEYSQPPIYGHSRLDEDYTGYRDFMLPGMIINLGFAVAIALSSITLIQERGGQTLERNYVCGISSAQMLLAHAVGRFLLNVPYAVMILLLPVLLFCIPFMGNLMTGVLIILLQSINGMAFGILVASLSRSLIMSMVATSGAFIICLFCSGTLWPIEAIPTRLRWISYMLPTTLATESLRSVMLRGWEMHQYQVWTSFVMVSTWIVVLLIIGIRLFKLNQ